MSFTDPLNFTYNGAVKALARVNQDSNGSDFYLDGTTEKFLGSIRHTIPKSSDGIGESHMLRLDVDSFDGSGVYVRRGSVWVVARTFNQAQHTLSLGYALNSLVGTLTTTNVAKLLAREI